MHFKPRQGVNTITFGKTFDHIVLVLPDPLNQIRCHADIQRTVLPAGENVNTRLSGHSMLWILASARMTTYTLCISVASWIPAFGMTICTFCISLPSWILAFARMTPPKLPLQVKTIRESTEIADIFDVDQPIEKFLCRPFSPHRRSQIDKLRFQFP